MELKISELELLASKSNLGAEDECRKLQVEILS